MLRTNELSNPDVLSFAIEMYKEGKSFQEIGDLLGGVERHVVSKHLRQAGVLERIEKSVAIELVEEYCSGHSAKFLSEKFGLSYYIVLKCVHEAGVPVRKGRGTSYEGKNRPSIELDEAIAGEIVAEYLDGRPITLLSDRFNFSGYMIRKCVSDAGVPLRKGNFSGFPCPVSSCKSTGKCKHVQVAGGRKRWLVNQWEKQNGLCSCGRKLDTRFGTRWKPFAKYKGSWAGVKETDLGSFVCYVCKRKKPSKGGWKKDKNGYIYIFVQYDHPFSSMRGGARRKNSEGKPTYSGGWILEHRLVMAEHYGRPLRHDEEVHHKNGIRDDNRFENLELWIKSQPAGQRVTDQIRWAKEILRRYGYLEQEINDEVDKGLSDCVIQSA